jgi:hypothetical protein
VWNEITRPSAQQFHSLGASRNLTGLYAGPLTSLSYHEFTLLALTYLRYTIFNRLCYESMTSALPPYRPYPYGLSAELKSGEEFCGKACSRKSHGCIPRTCSMESEVTSVDLVCSGLNLTLLSELANPLLYTSFWHVFALKPLSNLYFLNTGRLTAVKNVTV